MLEQGGSSATAVASTYNLWAAELLLVARMTRVLAEPVSAGTDSLTTPTGGDDIVVPTDSPLHGRDVNDVLGRAERWLNQRPRQFEEDDLG